jgi:hypothetical protein
MRVWKCEQACDYGNITGNVAKRKTDLSTFIFLDTTLYCERTPMNVKQVVALVAALIVFGLLMSLRSGVELGWQRAAIAALACGMLGLTIVFARAKRG